MSTKLCAMQESFNLVTVHGRPFELLDDTAFRNIIKLIPMNTRDYQSFNSHNIKSLLQDKADAIRSSIRQEVRNQLLSVKVDSATSVDRSFFGINIQYFRQAKLLLETQELQKCTLAAPLIFERKIVMGASQVLY